MVTVYINRWGIKTPRNFQFFQQLGVFLLLFTPVSITTLIGTEDARFILNGISPIAKGDLKWRDALLVTGTVNSNVVTTSFKYLQFFFFRTVHQFHPDS